MPFSSFLSALHLAFLVKSEPAIQLYYRGIMKLPNPFLILALRILAQATPTIKGSGTLVKDSADVYHTSTVIGSGSVEVDGTCDAGEYHFNRL